MKTVRNCK